MEKGYVRNIILSDVSIMLKFNEEKLAKLRTFEDHLREKYGEPGSEARKEFDIKVLCK